MGKQGFHDRSNDPYVYIESVSGESVAMGIDDTDDNFKVVVSAASGATPSGTATIDIDATTGNTLVNSSGTLLLDSVGITEINSSGASISIGNDAVAQAINIGTGAAARTITIGNTTGATAVNINIGTGDFTMTSATGTLINQLDTGEMTQPLQPAFLARNSAADNNVTGTGTIYTVICDTEIFDQGSDYNNATGTFTAPVTGRYYLGGQAAISGTTIATQFIGFITTSNGEWQRIWTRAASAANASCFSNCLADMDAGDVANFRVATLGEAADTDDVVGGAANITSFWGNLQV